MRALVTGGLGFIGSHVIEALLAEGIDVVAVDNLSTGSRKNEIDGATYRIEDLADTPDEILLDSDYVFHLAALPRIQPSFSEPVEHEEVNVVLTIRLLQRVMQSKRLKKLVFSSSSAVYGNPEQTPTPEDARIAPLSPYALQKYAAEQYCLLLGERFDLPVIALRYFNPYGPRSFNANNPYNAYSSVVGIFTNQKKSGSPLTITGDGLQERDFIDVRDVARANLAAARSPLTNRVYNVGTGSPISILELARRLDHPIEHVGPRLGEARITHADISRITAELDWRPAISIDEGVAELCAE
ncbi:UDP-glucose 4-epimerase [Tistlia consotensis]|uniref:UDP-glucose 4-epimerase n=1 Tax=Tistlia consotensis USBA 355 TaxID=560819 RepID=A0A1Y6BB34_9PROT|nr:NAD-dependent epimerase/dehydratase family protein [Tistlia consotensis]SME98716.1 UDP-glucose 4-epimerase [Tistlia consotensis USBA 355]SNR58113.1 UDP-glucose 4-epimerase [Tistlia consotensis]